MFKAAPQCPAPQGNPIRRKVPRQYPVIASNPPRKTGIVAYIKGKIAQCFVREKWEETEEIHIEHTRYVSREIRKRTRTYTRESSNFFGDY